MIFWKQIAKKKIFSSEIEDHSANAAFYMAFSHHF